MCGLIWGKTVRMMYGLAMLIKRSRSACRSSFAVSRISWACLCLLNGLFKRSLNSCEARIARVWGGVLISKLDGLFFHGGAPLTLRFDNDVNSSNVFIKRKKPQVKDQSKAMRIVVQSSVLRSRRGAWFLVRCIRGAPFHHELLVPVQRRLGRF